MYGAGRKRIRRRVPRLGVDAVQDADQIGAARREHALEPERELRREDLLAHSARLTVVTFSLKLMPAFSRLTWPQYSSACGV